jgi:epoxyqueuosine reductase
MEDASPLVRAMAVWAVTRLLALPAVRALHAQFGLQECDEAVRQEWFNP